MTAVFGKSVLDYKDPSDVHLTESACAATKNSEGLATVTTNFNQCGTVMEVNYTFLII